MDDMDDETDASGAGDDIDLELGDEDEEEMDMDFDLDDEEMDMDSEEDLEVIDLTGADDSEVINVFKKMSPEDEIEVIQNGGNIDIKDNATGAEYRIELGGESEMDSDDMDMDFEDMDDMDDMDMESDEDEMAEEVVYEIYMDDDMDDMDSEEEEEEVDESIAGKRKRYNRYSGSAHHPTNESKSPKFLELTKKNKVLQNKVSGIQSENEGVRESAIYFAGQYRFIDTENALIEQLKVEKKSDIKVLIGLALYRMNSEKGMNELQRLASKDENPRVRRMSQAIYNEYLVTNSNRTADVK
jgi:ribonuclease E